MTDEPMVQVEVPLSTAQRHAEGQGSDRALVLGCRAAVEKYEQENKPKPRYEADKRPYDDWVVTDLSISYVIARFGTNHPDPEAAAHAEAARLNGEPSFDPTIALTWNEREQAVYKTGHEEGERCASVDWEEERDDLLRNNAVMRKALERIAEPDQQTGECIVAQAIARQALDTINKGGEG